MLFCVRLNTETVYAFLYAVQYWNCLWFSVCSAILKLPTLFCIQRNTETSYAFLYAVQYWNCLCFSVCGSILKLPMLFCMRLNTETAYAFLYAAQYWNCLCFSVYSSILKLPILFCMQLNTETACAFLYAAQYWNCLCCSVYSAILKLPMLFCMRLSTTIVDGISQCSAMFELSIPLCSQLALPMHSCMQCHNGNIGLSGKVAQCWKMPIPFCVKANSGTTDTLLYATQYRNCRFISVCSVLLELPTPFLCKAVLELETPFCMQRRITGTVGTIFYWPPVQDWKCRRPFVRSAINELPIHFCVHCNTGTANTFLCALQYWNCQ